MLYLFRSPFFHFCTANTPAINVTYDFEFGLPRHPVQSPAYVMSVPSVGHNRGLRRNRWNAIVAGGCIILNVSYITYCSEIHVVTQCIIVVGKGLGVRVDIYR